MMAPGSPEEDNERTQLLPSHQPSETPGRRGFVKAICNRDFLCLLVATFLFAVSDALIVILSQVTTKEIICCEVLGHSSECHDEARCDNQVGPLLTSKLSALAKWQTISNAGFGKMLCSKVHYLFTYLIAIRDVCTLSLDLHLGICDPALGVSAQC